MDYTKRILKIKLINAHPTKELNKYVASSRYGATSDRARLFQNGSSMMMSEASLRRPNRHRYNHSLQSDMAYEPVIPFLRSDNITLPQSPHMGDRKMTGLNFSSMRATFVNDSKRLEPSGPLTPNEKILRRETMETRGSVQEVCTNKNVTFLVEEAEAEATGPKRIVVPDCTVKGRKSASRDTKTAEGAFKPNRKLSVADAPESYTDTQIQERPMLNSGTALSADEIILAQDQLAPEAVHTVKFENQDPKEEGTEASKPVIVQGYSPPKPKSPRKASVLQGSLSYFMNKNGG